MQMQQLKWGQYFAQQILTYYSSLLLSLYIIMMNNFMKHFLIILSSLSFVSFLICLCFFITGKSGFTNEKEQTVKRYDESRDRALSSTEQFPWWTPRRQRVPGQSGRLFWRQREKTEMWDKAIIHYFMPGVGWMSPTWKHNCLLFPYSHQVIFLAALSLLWNDTSFEKCCSLLDELLSLLHLF